MILVTLAIAGASGEVAAGREPESRLVAEWDPGWSAAELGARPRIDGYGVGGLGAYALDLDGGTLAVCVQADLGHTLDADYVEDARPTVASAPLDYLLWRYLSRRGMATDDQAAAINVLAWHYAAATRRGGGPVWTDDSPELTVDGIRLGDVETQVAVLRREAERRRGPWGLELVDTSWRGEALVVRVAVAGPGGPIAGVPVEVVVGAATAAGESGADGVAVVEVPGPVSGPGRIAAVGPGPARTFAAPGSQRLAVPTAAPLALDLAPAPPPTTVAPTTTSTTTTSTTTTSTTTTSTTTTTVPTTTSTAPTSTTIVPTATTETPPTSAAPTSTTTTAAPPTSSTVPAPLGPIVTPPITGPAPTSPSPTVGPPLARTGGDGARGVVRIASWAIALGSLTVLAASGRRRARDA